MLSIQRSLSKSFYILLSLPATAMGFALSVQISALSWILSTKFGFDIHEVGIVWAAGPIAGILGQVIIGFISDKTWFWGGRRRPYILIGGVFASLMLLALPYIDVIGNTLGVASLMGIAIAVALTLDLAINISFNPTRSIIADVTPDGIPRTLGYTWMQTISGFFGVLAYVISAGYGNYNLLYVGFVLVLVFSCIPVFFIKEPKYLGQSEEENIDKKPAMTSQMPELLKVYLAHAFSWIGIQTMFVFAYAYILDKMSGLSADKVGQILAISFAIMNTVGFIVPAFVLEPVIKRIGRVRTHWISMAIMALGYALIVYIGFTPTILYVLMAIVGIGWGAVVSIPFAIMTEKVNKNRMGFFMGIFNLSVVLPQLLVSLVISKFIADAPDKSLIFIVSAVSLALSAVVWTTVKETVVENFVPFDGAKGGH